jgi:hypothetical protein
VALERGARIVFSGVDLVAEGGFEPPTKGL